MIRIARGVEPQELASVRVSELTRVRAIAATGKSPDAKEIGDKYTVVKKLLWVQQWNKCCYCEKWDEARGNDLEHFRPKARASRGAGFPTHGYWWLAWTWSNLLFACDNCNRAEKRDEFPLDAGSTALTAENPPPGGEQALLVDPAGDSPEEDPIDFIQFKLTAGHWLPIGRAGNKRGEACIEVFGLARPELVTLYDGHVKDVIEPEIEVLKEQMARSGNFAGVHRQWKKIVFKELHRARPFSALSFDALDHYVPLTDRAEWGLGLPRPHVPRRS